MVVLFGGEADFEAADILDGQMKIRYWENGAYSSLPEGLTPSAWLENRILTDVEHGLRRFAEARANGEHTGKSERTWIQGYLEQLLAASDDEDNHWLSSWWNQQAWASEHPYDALRSS